MCHVRRGVMTGLVKRAGATALLAALAAIHASAQNAKPPVNGLRPAFEDADDEADNVRVKPALRRDRQNTMPGGTQAPGTAPTVGNPESSQPSLGYPAGSGAGRMLSVTPAIRAQMATSSFHPDASWCTSCVISIWRGSVAAMPIRTAASVLSRALARQTTQL